MASSPLISGRFTSISTRSGLTVATTTDLFAGYRLSHDLESIGHLHDHTRGLSEKRLVIDYENPHGHVLLRQ